MLSNAAATVAKQDLAEERAQFLAILRNLKAPGEQHVLTGVPRSGTTLTCHLLNQLPNTLALHGPINTAPGGSRRGVRHDRASSARRAPSARPRRVTTKHIGGKLPVSDLRALRRLGLRPPMAQYGEVRIDKPLGGFLLVIKRPAAFTALLEPGRALSLLRGDSQPAVGAVLVEHIGVPVARARARRRAVRCASARRSRESTTASRASSTCCHGSSTPTGASARACDPALRRHGGLARPVAAAITPLAEQ
jgi:hypothetical protein